MLNAGTDRGASGGPRSDLRGRLEKLLPAAAIGLASAGGAVVLARVPLKFMVAAVGGLCIAAVTLCLRDSRQLLRLVVAGLALTIPLNLDITFLHRIHTGGAPGLQVSASILCALALVGIAWYRRATGEQRPAWRWHRGLVFANVAFMVAGVLSLGNATYADLVWLEIVRIATLTLVMMTVTNLRGTGDLRWFAFWLSVTVAVQSMLACTQYLTDSSLGLGIFGEENPVALDIGVRVSRATGTVGHPNALGYFLEITMPVLLALALGATSARARMWYLGAFALTFAGTVATLSRGALITVPFSLGLVFVLVQGPRLLSARGIISVVLAGAVFLAVVIPSLPTIERRFVHDDYRSAASRIPLNWAAVSIIRQFPWVGVGLNNFAEVFKRYDTTGNSRHYTGRQLVGGQIVQVPFRHVVHNVYLWKWVEVGLIGLLAFLSVFAVGLFAAWRCFRRGSRWERALAVGIAAGLLAQLAHGMIDPGFPIKLNISILIYCLLGMLGGLDLDRREREARERARVRPGTAVTRGA